MPRDEPVICPIPGLGYCVRKRCNFWDEERQACRGEYLEEIMPLGSAAPFADGEPCTIYWTEDYD